MPEPRPNDAAQGPVEAPAELATLQEWMKRNNVATVALGFHGYGDEGQVELGDITPAEARHLQIDGKDIEEFACGLGYETLESYAPDWEDDEGASGEMLIDPANAMLRFGKRREEVQYGDPVDLLENGISEVSVLLEWMKDNGVRGLVIGVDGYNDEGQVEVRSIEPPEARKIEIEGQSLEEFVWFIEEAVSRIHPDWDSDFGGSGGIEITADDIAGGTGVMLEFGLRKEVFDYRECQLVPHPVPDAAPAP